MNKFVSPDSSGILLQQNVSFFDDQT